MSQGQTGISVNLLEDDFLCEKARQREIRFKALALMDVPKVPGWMTRSGIKHAQGTFGRVVMCFHKELKMDVAVKSLKQVSSTVKHTMNFFQEMEFLFAASGHPNIVQLLDVVCDAEKNLAFVFPRYDRSLETKLTDEIEKGDVPFMPLARYTQAFAGLWSALAFLAQRQFAHADLKPGNVCEVEEDNGLRFVLVDFGGALNLTPGCHNSPSRKETENSTSIQICSLPYRSPELLFGVSEFDCRIDVWSLGVVMVEVAAMAYIFRHLGDKAGREPHYRKFLRDEGDTTCDLSCLKASPWGTDQDWEVHSGQLIPEVVRQRIGEAGYQLLQCALRLDPTQRPCASEVLELSYFSNKMALKIWSPAASAANGGFVALAANEEGDDITVLRGGRGECQMRIGYLSPDVLQMWQSDAYWDQDHGWDWKNDKAHADPKMQKRARMEKPASAKVKGKMKDNAKLEIMGYCGKEASELPDGKPLRKSCNNLSCLDPHVVPMVHAYMEAFRDCNEPVFEWIDHELHHGPMSRLGDDLQANGKQILKTKARDWFGNVVTSQIERLWEHTLSEHYDGGAAAVLIVVTQEGGRTLTLFPTDGEPEVIDLKPGMVYLTSVWGINHQISYSGKEKGRVIPGLGEVGISFAYRTCLFAGSPFTCVRPGPEPVFEEFKRVLRVMHSKFEFTLPTAAQIKQVYAKATKKLLDAS